EPYLSRADVLLTGHAHAPRGSSPEIMPVRLCVQDSAHPLLDKLVMVRQKGGIKQVPLVYERAYGGAGWPDNPLGVGATADSGEPSVIDPFDEKRRAGFGPIGPAWPERKRLLGGRLRPSFDGAAVVDLPEDLDWDYFQAAPADQRVGFLRGDEWITLDGMHPEHPRLRTCLPGARGLGLVYGLGPWGVAEGQPLALHADMLRIDADEEHCTLTFRATFPVTDVAALPSVRVVLGVELPGKPVRWPDGAVFSSPQDSAQAPSPESEVIPLSSQDLEEAGFGMLDGTLRFVSSPEEDGSAVLLEDASLGVAPGRPMELEATLWSKPEPPRPSSNAPPRAKFAATLNLTEEAARGSDEGVLPFHASPSAPPPRLDGPRAQPSFPLDESGGTMIVLPEDEAPALPDALPFHGSVSSPSPLRQAGSAHAYADVPLSEGGGTMIQLPEDDAVAYER